MRERALLVVAFVLAGSSVVAAKYVSGALDPFSITFFSLSFAVAASLLLRGKKTLAALRRASGLQWRVFALQAVFGILLFRVFLTFGLQRTSSVEAGILTGTAPAFTALFTFVYLREKFTAASAGGIALTLAGILLLQGFPQNAAAFDRTHILGNLLVLCAAACESIFNTLARRLQTSGEEPVDPVVHAGIVSLLALVLSLIPMLLERPAGALPLLGIDGWLALVWYGAVVTVVAFASMFEAAKVCGGYTIAAFSGIMPLSSLLLSILVLRETVAYYQWIGCGCVVAAILLISRVTPNAER